MRAIAARVAFCVVVALLGMGCHGPLTASDYTSPVKAKESRSHTFEASQAKRSAEVLKARVFSASSPFNTVIPKHPAIDANGHKIVAYMTETRVHANLVEFGIPIFTTSASAPRYKVTCGRSPEWGRCPFQGVKIPIPNNARPNFGSDGAMVLIDPKQNAIYEFWQAHKKGRTWTTAWGSTSSLSGSGWSSKATGSGASRLGGVIRLRELQAGVIPHALVMQTNNACAKEKRVPATKTDGGSHRADCVPEGARLQLDPTIDVAKLPGTTSAERTIARALQRYGAYIVDVGQARLTISFELDHTSTLSNPGSLYAKSGLTWDYKALDNIPWQRMRVLSHWTGRPSL